KIAAAADEEKEPANTSKEKLVYFEPVIDHNIPMPPQVRAKRGRTKVARVKWPFTKMAIGDSVLLPEWAEPSRATAALE
ncbi:hypothetical protein PAI99_08850, partial [Campylobacter jejuni]|nr:hypothetical protein [Campylobacter jejuni]